MSSSFRRVKLFNFGKPHVALHFKRRENLILPHLFSCAGRISPSWAATFTCSLCCQVLSVLAFCTCKTTSARTMCGSPSAQIRGTKLWADAVEEVSRASFTRATLPAIPRRSKDMEICADHIQAVGFPVETMGIGENPFAQKMDHC